MPEKAISTRTPGPTGLRLGSWCGAALGAVGLGACVVITNLGGMAIMDEGGFVASGGPYEIAHPVPDGFWILPVAFVGLFVFPLVHGIFASRIKGFGLAYWTWCAVWTSIGATTFYYGFNPPGSDGLAWGWLIMGGIFLLVGLGSTWIYVSYLRSPNRDASDMPANRRLPYAAMVLVALAVGALGGFQLFGSVVG